jgi:SAM-dependent methyltransferase
MSNIRKITSCRLCGGDRLKEILDFGEVPLGNNLQESAEAARAAARYRLDLRRCLVCGHFQLGHAVAPTELYATNYTYLSGIGRSFIEHFSAYADWAISNCRLAKGATVVDVGSNDGTCLKAFQERGCKVHGVDPAYLPASIANRNGIPTINAFFDEGVVDQLKGEYGAVDLVTSHNVLAHVDELAATFANIRDLLKPGGFFCFEVGYFREVLQNNLFDTIYHEHLDYHHAAPLVRHLTALGFAVENIGVNSVQGGSIRVLCRNTLKGSVSPSVDEFLAAERDSIVNDEPWLTGWQGEIERRMAAFAALLREKASGKQLVAGFGAPTKATLLMKIAGIGEDEIGYVVEDNELKVGRFLPGTGIPIREAAHLFSATPDVLVIFAWNFSKDIASKIRGRFSRPVEMIVPLPETASSQI